jgi:hypothetical protein
MLLYSKKKNFFRSEVNTSDSKNIIFEADRVRSTIRKLFSKRNEHIRGRKYKTIFSTVIQSTKLHSTLNMYIPYWNLSLQDLFFLLVNWKHSQEDWEREATRWPERGWKGVGWRGAESYDRKKAWSSIYHSILSGRKYVYKGTCKVLYALFIILLVNSTPGLEIVGNIM